MPDMQARCSECERETYHEIRVLEVCGCKIWKCRECGCEVITRDYRRQPLFHGHLGLVK